MPNGTTVSALSGAGNAGHGGHGAFDADVVGARHAAADAHALAVPRQAVIGGAARDGVHQVLAASAAAPAACLLRASQAFSTSRMRSRTRPALQHAAVEQDVRRAGEAARAAAHRAVLDVDACCRRNRARCRVIAASAA